MSAFASHKRTLADQPLIHFISAEAVASVASEGRAAPLTTKLALQQPFGN
jgi:hypothetical protein